MAPKLRIEVTFLAALQQLAGRNTTWLDLPPGATVDRALALLRERMPQFAGVEVDATINGLPGSRQRPLAAGDGLYLQPLP